jgi:hypothetical protein
MVAGGDDIAMFTCLDIFLCSLLKMHKNAMKCNKTQSKWCINKHGA